MDQFSRRGERATCFERTLVAGSDHSALTEMGSLFLRLAQRIGIDALAVVLDEIGGEKIHIPSREFFFHALFRQQRDEEITRRLANGESAIVIGLDLGIAQRTVQHIAQRHRSDDAAPPEMVDRCHD
jgi:hypothetical protein